MARPKSNARAELLAAVIAWVADNGLGDVSLRTLAEAIGTFTTGRTKSREEIVELIPDRRLSYSLLSGLPLQNYRADIDLTPTASGTDIRWHSTFNARVGTGWAYRFGLGKFIAKCVRGLAAAAEKRATVAS